MGASPDLTVTIATGMGEARNAIIVASCGRRDRASAGRGAR
jgi:hypothetical protein